MRSASSGCSLSSGWARSSRSANSTTQQFCGPQDVALFAVALLSPSANLAKRRGCPIWICCNSELTSSDASHLTPHSRGDGFAGARQNQLTQAIDMARRLRAQEFALLIPWNRGQTLTEVLDRLRASPLPARLYADRKLRDVLVRQSDGAVNSHFSVRLQRAPLSRYNRWVKRLLDLVISCLLLLLLSPLLLATAVLVKLDSPGPVMFRQRRGGFDGREFLIFKFRTMFVLEDGAAIRQVSRNDRRVTRIGRVLRRTSIDELPQLLNVLRGDMSLVGPRPHAVAHDEAYRTQIDSYAMRRHVMPGLTGAAQVAGLRGETPHLRDMAQKSNWTCGTSTIGR